MPIKYSPRATAQRERALELRLKGLTYAEIGKALVLSRQRAQQLTCPPPAIQSAVASRANWQCESCGVPIRQGHVHHKEAKGMTPDSYQDLANLQYLCPSCHREAHAGPFKPRKRSPVKRRCQHEPQAKNYVILFAGNIRCNHSSRSWRVCRKCKRTYCQACQAKEKSK